MNFNKQTDRERPGRSGEAIDPLVMVAGMIVTVLLHGAVVGLIIWGTSRSDQQMEEKTEEKMLKFEDVDLLKLGEQMPQKQLPRISYPPREKGEEGSDAKEGREKDRGDLQGRHDQGS
ncbi:MAG: hypothetical protein ABEN55_10365 [Bradymonadaceae bacterium]